MTYRLLNSSPDPKPPSNDDNTERPPADWQVPEPPIREPDPKADPLDAPTDEPTENEGSIQV